MRLSEEEKGEMLALAKSNAMREDGELLRNLARDQVVMNGVVNVSRVLQFFKDYNDFLNHPMKERRPFIERIMKL